MFWTSGLHEDLQSGHAKNQKFVYSMVEGKGSDLLGIWGTWAFKTSYSLRRDGGEGCDVAARSPNQHLVL